MLQSTSGCPGRLVTDWAGADRGSSTPALVRRSVQLAEPHWLAVVKPDVDVATDGSLTYRIKLSVSFKYEDS
jgi:flavin-binding protein dodecin